MAEAKESSCDDEEEEFQRPVKANGRYVDPWGTVSFPSSYDVFKWRFLEKSERGIRGTLRNLYRFNVEELDQNLPVLHPVRSALESPPEGSIQVTWLGHATVLVQMDGLNILTDPVFSTHCGPTWLLSLKRYRPIPCSVSDLPEIDAVCISHNHYDHLDYNTVTNLNHRFGDKLHWFVPMGLARWMFQSGCNNVTELEWWDGKEHPKRGIEGISTKFIFTPNQHWCRRSLGDRNKVLWGSWTIIGPHHKFFFAGDTGYCKGFKQIGKKFGPFDFAAIPIGAYKPRWFLKFQHVDPVEAVCIHEDIRSCSSLGIHWGTFPTGYEHYLDPPKDLLAALEDKGISHSSFFTLKHGETRVIEQIEPANNS